MSNSKYATINSIFNLQYIALMVVSFFVSGSFYLINTSLSAYVVSIGASLTMAGIILGSFSITSLITRPFSGVIVNRVNKAHVMMGAIVLMFIASIAYAFIKNPTTLIFVRVIHGVGFSLYSTVSLVLISSAVPKDKIGEGVSYFGLAQMLASAFMPNLGAWISESWGYNAVFFVTIIIFILGGICIAFLKLENPGTESIQKSENNGKQKKISFGEIICLQLMPLSMLGALFSMFNGINSSFMLQIGSSRGIGNIALYFTVNTIAIITIRILLSRIADKKSIYYVIVPATISSVIAAIMIGGASSLLIILIAAVFQAAGQGMAQPNLQAECIKGVDLSRRGTASSTYYMCSDIGQGMGVMIGGAISDRWSYAAMYYVIAAIFLVSVLICITNMIRSKTVLKGNKLRRN